MPGRLPIIYVRGFAGGTRGIDRAVEDPLYGFNEGSTQVRVNGSGDPVYHQFESPVLRLIGDHGYRLFVQGGQEAYLNAQADRSVEQASIWVHRFYDSASSHWDQEGRGFEIEAAAEDLLRLVRKVLARTGAPRVHLVAHSMGGLVCRSMIQRVIPRLPGPDPQGRRLAVDYVDRLFTYGTPHGGIEFAVGMGLVERLRDALGINGADIFGPRRMYQYLSPDAPPDAGPPEGWDARVMPDDENFPLSRIFCLVGTNAGDYPVAAGLSARAVGPRSDGLVQIENAVVSGPEEGGVRRTADHAFVHRSHSGPVGLVNSEEGFQNLSRFLFGDVRVTAELVHLRLPDADDLTWQAETQVSIRGLPTLMHERTAANKCPILVEPPDDDALDVDRPVPMVTTYLSTDVPRPGGVSTMRFTLHVRVLSLREKDGLFSFDDHVEQTTDFDDTLVVDVRADGDGLDAWALWASQIEEPLRRYAPSGEPLHEDAASQGTSGLWILDVPLPRSGQFLGGTAAVRLTCT